MLNELLLVERGASKAGIQAVTRHPDVKDAGRLPGLLVQFEKDGQVAGIWPVPKELKPWTLRAGQHNSFPFVQPKAPLWSIPSEPHCDALCEAVLDKRNADRRNALFELAGKASFNTGAFMGWPGAGMMKYLEERRRQLAGLECTQAEVVLDSIAYFLAVCRQGDGPRRLLARIAGKVMEEIVRSPQEEWLELASALLLGSYGSKKNSRKCGAALLFEAFGKDLSIVDPRLIAPVSDALSLHADAEDIRSDVCGLTGSQGPLLAGNFPQPNLPVLGQTYVFAKNSAIPAFDRYGRFAADAMPVGRQVAGRLAAALTSLTSGERKYVTWRDIPGEVPKQYDLLLAFVEEVLPAPVAEVLAEDDFSGEDPSTSPDSRDSVAVFEQRTERLIKLIRAEVGDDVTKTPVQIVIFRKVDPGNRKVVHCDVLTVAGLDQAGRNWVRGERNVPSWLVLPIFLKGEPKPLLMHPPHIAPLGLTRFSKSLYIRGGTERQDVTGMPASEALGLFLDRSERAWRGRARRFLQLILRRRMPLLAGVGHLQHMPGSWERRSEAMKKYDYYEALRTVTLLGVALDKLDRGKESYMKGTAFKLGQLLATADIVHAGYCADVRGGETPSSLLGNQVFAIAQADPVKALATLCRRWKPYDGWTKKAVRDLGRIESMIAGTEKDARQRKIEQQRGWDIRKALRHARDIAPIAAELASELPGCKIDDGFRAEMLLGYIAGLPKKEDSSSN